MDYIACNIKVKHL